jgi:transcriptional regulator with XRE-family HTH domain
VTGCKGVSHTKVMTGIAKVCPVPTGTGEKSLPHAQEERVREILRGIVDGDFKGNKSAAARGLKISQSYVTETLAGNRTGGTKLLTALANYTHRSIDDLLGRRPAEVTREHDADSQLPRTRPVLGNHRDFEAHFAEFWRRLGDSGDYDADIKRAVGEFTFGTGVREDIDWMVIKNLADAIMRARKIAVQRAAQPETGREGAKKK